jgi:hypothetical protein
MIVADYFKSEGLVGLPQFVVRVLPYQVGDVLVTYLTDVLPFIELVLHGTLIKPGATVEPKEEAGTALGSGYSQ